MHHIQLQLLYVQHFEAFSNPDAITSIELTALLPSSPFWLRICDEAEAAAAGYAGLGIVLGGRSGASLLDWMFTDNRLSAAGRCVCRHCPQGVMACQDNFMKKYQHHGMTSGSYGGGVMCGQPGSKPNYPTAGVSYQQPGMMPANPTQYHGGMMPGQGSMPYGQPGSIPYGQPGSMPYSQSGVAPGMAPMMPGNPYPPGGMPGQIRPYGNTPGMPGQPPFY
ncbi:hypothetical protein T265_03127 [Opisthorchis viverrini]|uniref:Uncharacterized protein n=1 Tax=Opisthorchis viverrini TaxID=6198 RepID=A0A075AHV0_OPIVI|nr:hypothetical protein T265_03127 [Opisthorchis viverrini]KER30519.1 hypothetical protein T265_03127 [Opisthorchis viverrini]